MFDNATKIRNIFDFLEEHRDEIFKAAYDSEDGREEFMIVLGNENLRIVLRRDKQVYLSRLGYTRGIISTIDDDLHFRVEAFLHSLPFRNYTEQLDEVWDHG
uniref:Uncharacterized protein n=1 Tax=Ochrobactrum phage ORM_20 TaxID=2985243 RepID=A0A9N6WWS7_9VIRU|nr:hypothetical protein ORM20_00172 [Ochrobactrum phage ORM_20]